MRNAVDEKWSVIQDGSKHTCHLTENTAMTSISITDWLTTIYGLVDDWYQAEGQNLLAGKPGPRRNSAIAR